MRDIFLYIKMRERKIERGCIAYGEFENNNKTTKSHSALYYDHALMMIKYSSQKKKFL